MKRHRNRDLLFVYGTLLSGTGSRMHRWLSANAEFVDHGTFQGRLFLLGNYPGLVASRRSTDRVKGEIYRLRRPGRTLAKLDAYEVYDAARPSQSEYLRVLRTVRCAAGGSLECWIYLYNRSGKRTPRIASGNFLTLTRMPASIASMESSMRGQWSLVDEEVTS